MSGGCILSHCWNQHQARIQGQGSAVGRDKSTVEGAWVLFWAWVAMCSVPEQDRGLLYMLPDHTVQYGVYIPGSPGSGL